MPATRVSQLYVVELHTRGWGVGVSHSPEERILTTIFRLSRDQKNRLQYLKVKFYRAVKRWSVFTLGEKYVVPQRRLPEVEAGFKEVYSEFVKLRRKFFEEIAGRWEEIKKRLEERASRMGVSVDLSRLKPSDEGFLDMRYTVTPLGLSVEQIINVSEEFEKLAKEREEYRSLASRLREEAERTMREVKEKYEEKVAELEKTVEKLKKALKEKGREAYRLKLRARMAASDAEEIAAFLGPETVEDLRVKLEALKEYFAT
ncbi:MAG: hypothetical protein QXR81_06795 [Candidatus Nezhaarchaeales archaeon]